MGKVLFKISSVLLYLISLLPFNVLYIIADLIYFLMYYLSGYRKDVVKKNLSNAFPGKSDRERKVIAKKFFHNLADVIVETIKMRSISLKELDRRFKFTNASEIKKHYDNNRSVLIASGHYGNWEWGPLRLSAYFDEPVIVIFKPLTDKRFESFFNSMRARFGAHLVAMKLTLRKLVEFKDKRYSVTFASDQTPVKGETQYFTPFLNQPTSVFLGIEKIARMTNHPVVFGHINRVKRGYYECTFKTLFENPADTAEYESTESHTRALEQVIMAKPELWLWSHRRWKFKPEDLR
jgi:KDO2-lipid IV(A) lauroyltransferase